MFDSQTIQCQGTTATTVYSPWFPRGGDYGIFTVEVASFSASHANFSLSVQMIHKNSDEVGDTGSGGGTVGSAFSVVSTGGPRTSSDITAGFKELVRYKFTLQYITTGTGTNWAIFRMLPPIWYDAVKV